MTASAAAALIEGDLIARREGACGVIRLNRPKAINAVTLEMFRDVDKALDAFEADPAVAVILLEGAGERGLCAGGDIRALWESSKVKGDLGKILWREEYILNARIKKFPKPYVSFMDGIVMGGGVGLSAHSQPSRRDRQDETGHARSRPRLLSRCRRHLAVVAFAGRDRHVLWIDRADHERSGRDPCRLCRCGRAVGQACRLARGADQGSRGDHARGSQSLDRWLRDR